MAHVKRGDWDMSAAEILQSALSLPADDRATIAHELLRSLPAPKIYETEEELAAEINRRMGRIESGQETFYDAEDTLRRAREALARSRRS
jgi:putative addiction module component (TIGR02574 family)